MVLILPSLCFLLYYTQPLRLGHNPWRVGGWACGLSDRYDDWGMRGMRGEEGCGGVG